MTRAEIERRIWNRAINIASGFVLHHPAALSARKHIVEALCTARDIEDVEATPPAPKERERPIDAAQQLRSLAAFCDVIAVIEPSGLIRLTDLARRLREIADTLTEREKGGAL